VFSTCSVPDFPLHLMEGEISFSSSQSDLNASGPGISQRASHGANDD
jgi:hypothetical protein